MKVDEEARKNMLQGLRSRLVHKAVQRVLVEQEPDIGNLGSLKDVVTDPESPDRQVLDSLEQISDMAHEYLTASLKAESVIDKTIIDEVVESVDAEIDCLESVLQDVAKSEEPMSAEVAEFVESLSGDTDDGVRNFVTEVVSEFVKGIASGMTSNTPPVMVFSNRQLEGNVESVDPVEEYEPLLVDESDSSGQISSDVADEFLSMMLKATTEETEVFTESEEDK